MHDPEQVAKASVRCPDFRSCSASWLQTLPLPSLQALRNKRRDADKAAKELEVESAALEDFAAEAETAEAEAEDNSQVRCQRDQVLPSLQL
jgi:hypothetical protein